MSRFTIGLVVAASLTLTAYFGAAAWRASDDRHWTLQDPLHQQAIFRQSADL